VTTVYDAQYGGLRPPPHARPPHPLELRMWDLVYRVNQTPQRDGAPESDNH